MNRKIRRVGYFFLYFAIGILYLAPCLFSLDDNTQDKYPSLDQPRPIQVQPADDPRGDKFSIVPSVDIQAGYDNNVELSPSRFKDGFFQNIFSVPAEYQVCDDLSLEFGVDLFDTLYLKYNRNNILDVMPYAGFRWQFAENTYFSLDCSFDYLKYPNYKENDYLAFEVRPSVRQYVAEGVYHEAGYKSVSRHYPDSKAYMSDGAMGNSDRSDIVNEADYTIGCSLGGATMLKLANVVSVNDSNDMYQDYYDSSSYGIKPSFTHYFTEKFYVHGEFISKLRSFDDRRATDNDDKTVTENTLTYTGSCYYNLTRSVSVNISFSYKENYPNDPFYKYSGLVVSSGMYFEF
ncbi:MAG: hypothetical protein HQL30_04300 [Candidatus Omnitrophica bacterium]|nr:hypothetical protein [Candidatus Omnitrophota bacterium]